MKNPAPYLRQRSDDYWEIVFEDPETGKTRRKTTKTKNEEEAQKKLAEFQPGAAPVDPDAPRLRQRKDGYWETVYKDEDGKTRRHGQRTQKLVDRPGAEDPAPALAANAASGHSAIEIDIAGGHQLRIIGAYDPEALARLIRGLNRPGFTGEGLVQ